MASIWHQSALVDLAEKVFTCLAACLFVSNHKVIAYWHMQIFSRSSNFSKPSDLKLPSTGVFHITISSQDYRHVCVIHTGCVPSPLVANTTDTFVSVANTTDTFVSYIQVVYHHHQQPTLQTRLCLQPTLQTCLCHTYRLCTITISSQHYRHVCVIHTGCVPSPLVANTTDTFVSVANTTDTFVSYIQVVYHHHQQPTLQTRLCLQPTLQTCLCHTYRLCTITISSQHYRHVCVIHTGCVPSPLVANTTDTFVSYIQVVYHHHQQPTLQTRLCHTYRLCTITISSQHYRHVCVIHTGCVPSPLVANTTDTFVSYIQVVYHHHQQPTLQTRLCHTYRLCTITISSQHYRHVCVIHTGCVPSPLVANTTDTFVSYIQVVYHHHQQPTLQTRLCHTYRLCTITISSQHYRHVCVIHTGCVPSPLVANTTDTFVSYIQVVYHHHQQPTLQTRLCHTYRLCTITISSQHYRHVCVIHTGCVPSPLVANTTDTFVSYIQVVYHHHQQPTLQTRLCHTYRLCTITISSQHYRHVCAIHTGCVPSPLVANTTDTFVPYIQVVYHHHQQPTLQTCLCHTYRLCTITISSQHYRHVCVIHTGCVPSPLVANTTDTFVSYIQVVYHHHQQPTLQTRLCHTYRLCTITISSQHYRHVCAIHTGCVPSPLVANTTDTFVPYIQVVYHHHQQPTLQTCLCHTYRLCTITISSQHYRHVCAIHTGCVPSPLVANTTDTFVSYIQVVYHHHQQPTLQTRLCHTYRLCTITISSQHYRHVCVIHTGCVPSPLVANTTDTFVSYIQVVYHHHQQPTLQTRLCHTYRLCTITISSQHYRHVCVCSQHYRHVCVIHTGCVPSPLVANTTDTFVPYIQVVYHHHQQPTLQTRLCHTYRLCTITISSQHYRHVCAIHTGCVPSPLVANTTDTFVPYIQVVYHHHQQPTLQTRLCHTYRLCTITISSQHYRHVCAIHTGCVPSPLVANTTDTFVPYIQVVYHHHQQPTLQTRLCHTYRLCTITISSQHYTFVPYIRTITISSQHYRHVCHTYRLCTITISSQHYRHVCVIHTGCVPSPLVANTTDMFVPYIQVVYHHHQQPTLQTRLCHTCRLCTITISSQHYRHVCVIHTGCVPSPLVANTTDTFVSYIQVVYHHHQQTTLQTRLCHTYRLCTITISSQHYRHVCAIHTGCVPSPLVANTTDTFVSYIQVVYHHHQYFQHYRHVCVIHTGCVPSPLVANTTDTFVPYIQVVYHHHQQPTLQTRFCHTFVYLLPLVANTKTFVRIHTGCVPSPLYITTDTFVPYIQVVYHHHYANTTDTFVPYIHCTITISLQTRLCHTYRLCTITRVANTRVTFHAIHTSCVP